MATFPIPKNLGKVKVAKGLGHKWVVWNGKQGKGEFVIPCRDREQAQEVAKMINAKKHGGTIEVLMG
jgi:hypothetical protein